MILMFALLGVSKPKESSMPVGWSGVIFTPRLGTADGQAAMPCTVFRGHVLPLIGERATIQSCGSRKQMRSVLRHFPANGNRSFTGNYGLFAENRVRTCVMALKIPSSKDDYHLLKETHMNALSSKLTVFAAALAMNGLVLGALGYLFVLQSHPNMSAIAFVKAVVAQQGLG